MSELMLPSPVLRNYSPHHVAEVRNHIIVSRWLAEQKHTGTAGMSLEEIKGVSRALLRNTLAESLYKNLMGGPISLGEFRITYACLNVDLDRKDDFPSAQEVPGCMERFIAWRDKLHAEQKLHPLVFAAHQYVYFCHIHPFLDGTGRVGRSIMLDYMIRHGYIPMSLPNTSKTTRKAFQQMVGDASGGNPEEFIHLVVSTQSQTW